MQPLSQVFSCSSKEKLYTQIVGALIHDLEGLFLLITRNDWLVEDNLEFSNRSSGLLSDILLPDVTDSISRFEWETVNFLLSCKAPGSASETGKPVVLIFDVEDSISHSE